MNNAKIGAALLGGYVLGRTKKAKLAIGLGAMLAGSRVNPAQLGKTLQQSPFVNTLTKQVRTELTGAGKAAASSVLTAKADSLADALHARTTGLREKAQEADEEDEEDEEGTAESEEPEEAEETDEADEDEEEKHRAKTRRKTSGQAAKKTSSTRSRSRSGTSRAKGRDDG
ncbi:hypothetical protein [Streptomyces sp. P17]|uniref:hypothetical protein n=1 Tax=Streptomyces sp. P17 TaxID=3074716 RepID=UPI0028F443C9|nr:hypothetical protein [Streptomyces sp. P17]MDT9701597.1 hypothetical protein [Streptomyces sp. P17]